MILKSIKSSREKDMKALQDDLDIPSSFRSSVDWILHFNVKNALCIVAKEARRPTTL